MSRIDSWKNLQSIDQLDKIKEQSDEQPIVIFKHSTRCSISSMVKNRLESDWDEQEMEKARFYYLDLIAHRDVSNQIALDFEVKHQSPQLIVIKDGKAIYDDSHMAISFKSLKDSLN